MRASFLFFPNVNIPSPGMITTDGFGSRSFGDSGSAHFDSNRRILVRYCAAPSSILFFSVVTSSAFGFQGTNMGLIRVRRK